MVFRQSSHLYFLICWLSLAARSASGCSQPDTTGNCRTRQRLQQLVVVERTGYSSVIAKRKQMLLNYYERLLMM